MVTIAGIQSTSVTDWTSGTKDGEINAYFKLNASFQCSYGSLGNVRFAFPNSSPWDLIGQSASARVSGLMWGGYKFYFPTQFNSEERFQSFVSEFLAGTSNATINAVNNNADVFVLDYSSNFHMPALNYNHNLADPIRNAFFRASLYESSVTFRLKAATVIPSKYLSLSFYYYDYATSAFIPFADGQNKPASSGGAINTITCSYTLPENQTQSIFACVATIGAEIIDDAESGASHMAYSELWSASVSINHYVSLTVTYGEHGTGTPIGTTENIITGSLFPILKIQADNGYVVNEITVNNTTYGQIDCGICNYLEFIPSTYITADTEINVSFTTYNKPTLTIISSPKAGGYFNVRGFKAMVGSGGEPIYVIDPDETNYRPFNFLYISGLEVDFGDEFAFTITENSGYHLSDVQINGVSYGAIEGATISNIQTNQVVKAIFEPIPTEPTTPTPDPVRSLRLDWNYKGIFPNNHPSKFAGYRGFRK